MKFICGKGATIKWTFDFCSDLLINFVTHERPHKKKHSINKESKGN